MSTAVTPDFFASLASNSETTEENRAPLTEKQKFAGALHSFLFSTYQAKEAAEAPSGKTSYILTPIHDLNSRLLSRTADEVAHTVAPLMDIFAPTSSALTESQQTRIVRSVLPLISDQSTDSLFKAFSSSDYFSNLYSAPPSRSAPFADESLANPDRFYLRGLPLKEQQSAISGLTSNKKAHAVLSKISRYSHMLTVGAIFGGVLLAYAGATTASAAGALVAISSFIVGTSLLPPISLFLKQRTVEQISNLEKKEAKRNFTASCLALCLRNPDILKKAAAAPHITAKAAFITDLRL